MAKNPHPIVLPHSEIALSTYYTANWNMYRRGPVSDHIFRLGRFYGVMDNAVEVLGETFESDDDDLTETIALSGLREYVSSLAPRLGGSINDQEHGIQYLRSVDQQEPQKLPGPYHWQCISGSFSPYHSLPLAFRNSVRVSRFDLSQMVTHIMTNTELQDSYAQFGLPTDPRLALIESVKSTLVSA